MSKVKEKVMEEEMKEKGEVEKVGRVRKKKMPLPGSFENPFRCGQGLNCPWVNGEKGRRCVLWHPLPALHCTAILDNTASDKISAMKADGMEKEEGMVEEVQKEETEFVKEKVMVKNEEKKLDNMSANESLLKSAPEIKKGADSSTRKRFTALLQEARPARSTQMPKEHVLGKAKSNEIKLKPQPKRKECRHMQKVKSLSKGWAYVRGFRRRIFKQYQR